MVINHGNVRLGEAAKRGVGTAANQLPDMSCFMSSVTGNGYMNLPGGLILQWGILTGASKYTFSFPIAFPTGGSVLVGMAHTTDVAEVSLISTVNGFIKDKKMAYLASSRVVNGVPQFYERSIHWYALGR
uniref:Tail fiber protein n=1 Tax=feces metagenome TaxID=1861841 RepID=A0A7M2QNP8_9ZZZZ